MLQPLQLTSPFPTINATPVWRVAHTFALSENYSYPDNRAAGLTFRTRAITRSCMSVTRCCPHSILPMKDLLTSIPANWIATASRSCDQPRANLLRATARPTTLSLIMSHLWSIHLLKSTCSVFGITPDSIPPSIDANLNPSKRGPSHQLERRIEI